MDWKGALKDAAVLAGKGVVKGTKAVAKALDESAKRAARKEAILSRMSDRQVKAMAKHFGVKPSEFISDPDPDDYRSALQEDCSFETVLEYAKGHGVKVSDIEAKLARERQEAERAQYQANGLDGLAATVAAAVARFEPAREFKKEFPYQLQLHGFLQAQFPTARIEEAKGSSRPDITISGVAIEVKGPTRDRDLVTISDKCLRYPEHFTDGLIVVLFAVEVNEQRYEEWRRSMQRRFPDVVVIRK